MWETTCSFQIRSKITNHFRNSRLRTQPINSRIIIRRERKSRSKIKFLTSGDHGLDAEVLWHLDRDLGGLQGKLSGRHNDHALDDVLGGVDLLQAGNRVRSSLSGSVLCSRQNVPEIGFQGDIPTKSGSNSPSWEGDRNARFLDWAWLLPTFLKNTLASEAITYQSYCYMIMISCS